MPCGNVKTDEHEDAEPACTRLQHGRQDADVEVLLQEGDFAVPYVRQFLEEDVLQRIHLNEFDVVYGFGGGGDAL